MNNLSVLLRLCTLLCSSFYPDKESAEIALFNEGIDKDANAKPKDASILRLAVAMVKGYVESSRSEGGISVSVRDGAVKESIKYWCGIYGLDPSEFIEDELRTIEDGTHLW